MFNFFSTTSSSLHHNVLYLAAYYSTTRVWIWSQAILILRPICIFWPPYQKDIGQCGF